MFYICFVCDLFVCKRVYNVSTDDIHVKYLDSEKWSTSIIDFYFVDQLQKYKHISAINTILNNFKAKLVTKLVKNTKKHIYSSENIINPLFKSLKRLKIAQLCAAKAPTKNVMFI